MANNKYDIDSKDNILKSGKNRPRIFKNKNIRDLRHAPLKISLIYLILGFMWIFYSDDIITKYTTSDIDALRNLQTFKGLFYVLITATILYLMFNNVMKIIRIKEDSREKSYRKLVESKRKLKASMNEIKKFEYYDFLTCLPNRGFMAEKIENMLKIADDNTRFSLLFLDLDNFKMVNDILGHDYGDQLLKNIAWDLRKCIDERDIVARLGGDEFIILLADESDKEKIENKARRILNLFSRQWSLSGKEFFITASAGIVIYPYDGADLQTLYKNADTAMYQAKESGKNCFLFFRQYMNEKVSEKLELENKLRKAIKNEEFIVYYQPQIDIGTMQVKGVEALVRWNHPIEGIIQPAKFIPVAEESGLIVEIDEFVMRTACKQLKSWIDSDIEPVTISVNLTSKEFQQANFVDLLKEIINDTGLRADFIEIEITESLVMKDIDVTLPVLKDLKSMGVRISLDDFGTGYSSLNYLKRLPIDTIKIDKSFIDEITEDSKEEAIAESIIALAHKMNLSVVAEGIETKKQLEFIKEQKCDKAQGYYFSKPLPVDEIERLLSVPSIYIN
ncbi:putative bifunctional diguanylate cyclase/phosphodiesterase [Pseudobacteroides cellulosolvens]|uniref:Diguanylate cyclase/phosphodiesterase n=1 Tax=Pseudobacteroides cellulosolvens ATCC 35603 = DSM 2933 TaxID=398512 RepID=A0A0L6JHU0_9FIRM|nr:EAL domain-containing protein [Pseudobacteroides cellulosolvens]KNY25284.1 diguanylate cyclase/phosphodiesterase [Pseudobacteroides cellulosolvens ATCC 35603 = DSM 2933]